MPSDYIIRKSIPLDNADPAKKDQKLPTSYLREENFKRKPSQLINRVLAVL
jgi:hypothetical protein